MRLARIVSSITFCLWVSCSLSDCVGGENITVTEHPDFSRPNPFYVVNRAPLEPSRLISLPIGSIEPKGWLREVLSRERDGLAGHLDKISPWLEKDGNAWLSRDGKGKHGWEEVPYWLRGYIQLAYIFNDPKMIAESDSWIEGALNSQRLDGDFGPDQEFADDGSRDFWANMVMMYCFETYYERSQDRRVLNLLTKYFQFQLSVPEDKFLTHDWQKMRGGDNLYSVYWLYNRTGDPQLLELAAKIHRCSANWRLNNDLPSWHNVNIAEGFREPATYFMQSHHTADLQSSYADFQLVRQLYGQVPGGMYGGDENCRPGYSDPRQGIETCGMVEQMLSDELLIQISGDTSWADNCEDVAFNTLPAALTADLRALRYLTAPNMVVSDSKNHSPGIQNAGPFLMMNPFSSRCCQHNHSMGWPYFNKHLWFATPDAGLCAMLYAANDVRARVGDGSIIHIEESTRYPFQDTIHFRLHSDKPVTFPLYLRMPGWCQSATVFVNGKRSAAAPESGKYLQIEREWNDGDLVVLNLPMNVRVQRWSANHNSVSVDYGPLTFSLKIGEHYVRQDSTKTAQTDSGWQKAADPAAWPAFDIYPETPWNYGLVLDGQHPETSFTIKTSAWPDDNFPFTPGTAPITLLARAKRIPEWTLDRFGLPATLQDSPAGSDQREESIELIPMGAARLRIAAFPTIGSQSNAHRWIPPEK